jgi:SSS family solute:Na+ symporter
VATLLTRDFYLRRYPDASQERQVRAGRWTVLAVFVMGALWAPVIGQFESLWLYLQSVGAYLMMPFVAVFYLGVLWRRVTTEGVIASLIAGFIAGPLIMYDSRHPFLPLLSTPLMRPWLHGAILEFLICLAVLAVVSMLTPRMAEPQLATTTVDWGSRLPDERRATFLDYRLWLGFLLAVTATLWWLMR